MRNISIPNIYTAFWLLFHMLGFLRLGSIETTLGAILIAWSLYYVVLVNNRKKVPPLLKIMNLLLFVLIIYGVHRFFIPQKLFSTPAMFIVSYLYSIPPIYAYYYFFDSGKIDSRWLSKMAIVFIVVGICQYFYRYGMLSQKDTFSDGFVNNSGYIMTALVPMTIFIKRNNFLKYSILSIILILAVISMKRGAILIALVSSLLLFFYYSKGTAKSKLQSIIGVLFVVGIIAYYISAHLSSDSFFMDRVTATLEGDTSNREVMYDQLYYYITHEESMVRRILGYGADGTLILFNTLAHNDWYEFAIDMGLLGLVLYLIYWITFLKTIHVAKKNSTAEVVLILRLIFITYFLRALFSMSLNRMTVFSTVLLGYALAMVYSEKDRQTY